jgi:hypothetical protein
MRSINYILKEGLLDNPEKSLAKGEAVMKKDILNELKNELNPIGWYTYASDALYEKIINTCKQAPDNEKKGTRWRLIIPDKKSNFKPIFVALHKGLYRNTKGADKELYGTTVSAMHKRISKEVKSYKENHLSNGWVPSVAITFLAFLMNEYTYVSNTPGSNWYTVYISTFTFNEVILVSYNPSTKEWTYGTNGNVPSFVNNTNIVNFTTVSNVLLRDDTDTQPLYTGYLNTFVSALPHGNPKDFKKTSKFWKRITFSANVSFIGNQVNISKNTYIYVHTTNFVYLTYEDIINQ